MGFLSKIKNSFSHGNIKVELQAPNTVKAGDASFSVRATIVNAGSENQTINSVKVSLIEDRAGENSKDRPGSMFHEVASASNNTPFVISPGTSQAVDIAVPLNFGKNLQETLPDLPPILGAAAGALGKVQTVADALDQGSGEYFVKVVADVNGLSFDPSARTRVQYLKPGQIGGSLKVG